MAEYTLPDLPYDYAALEPHVSAEIMQLHHDKHHAAYVAGANQTLEKLAAARDKDDFGAIVGLEKTLAFHISGHVLHSIFWNNQSPDGGDKPDGALGSAIDENFGSFDKFKAQFTQPPRRFRARAGASWRTSPSPADSLWSRSTTTRAASATARSRSSSSTPGSTPSTCSTRT
jgi:superoxide dismutase